MNKIIFFEDQKQEFFTIEVDETKRIVSLTNFDHSIFYGCYVKEIPSPGGFVTIETHGSDTGPMTLKYKVEKVVDAERSVTKTKIHLTKIFDSDETRYYVNGEQVAEFKHIVRPDFEKLTIINHNK